MKNVHQNLLPLEFRKRLLFAVRLRQWCKIWCATLLVLLGGGFLKYAETQQINRRWEDLHRQTKPIEQAKHTNGVLTEQYADLEHKIAIIDRVNDVGHHLAVIGLISQSARRTGDVIQIQACTLLETVSTITPNPLAQGQRPPQEKLATPSEQHGMKIELRGLSVDERAIARFVKTLKEVEFFAAVELKTVRGTEVSNQNLRAYQIECAL